MSEQRAPAVQTDRKGVRDLLIDSHTQQVFKAILPQHFTPERMIRLAIAATTRTPKLGECHPMTLLGAFIECAALGLEPNSPLQHVHLLPFWNSKLNGYEITRIIGYRGYIELANRTGRQISLHADVAYDGDEFDFSYGSQTFILHKPKLSRPENAPPIASYCHVNLTDGQAFLVVPWSDVLKTKARSKSANNGPWVTDLDRMARKTAIRRLYGGGEVPMSIEMAAAVNVDEQPMNYAALADARVDEIKEALHSFVGEQQALPSSDPMDRIVDRNRPQGETKTTGRTADQQQDQKSSGGSKTSGDPKQASTAPGETSLQAIRVAGKDYVKPGAAANALIKLVEECTEDGELDAFHDPDSSIGPAVSALPDEHRNRVALAVAQQRNVLRTDHADPDERPQMPAQPVDDEGDDDGEDGAGSLFPGAA